MLEDLKAAYGNNEIEFDTKPHLIAFKTMVYDLIKHELRKIEPTDYISMSTGYDLDPRDEVKIKYLHNLFTKIMPEEQARKCLLSIYAQALYGQNIREIYHYEWLWKKW